MKKLLTALLVSSLLVLPFANAALASYEEASVSPAAQEFLPGDVPAQTDAVESMTPAVHALVLAMLNHDAGRFDLGDSQLVWEGLYNMLSLYGQMDSRSDGQDGELLLPEETVRDYAAALAIDLDKLGEPPAALWDRINYDNVSRSYVVVCGAGDLARIQTDSLGADGGNLTLTGSLVYEVDNEVLVSFQATLQPADSMFGYTLTALSLAG